MERPRFHRLLQALSALVLLVAGLHAQRLGPRTGPALPGSAWPLPNLLVIVADDIGWRDIDPSIPTPNIDALVRDGVSFRRAYSMPYCSPSRFAVLFGMQPFREQLGNFIDPNLPGDVSVSPSRLSLARLLEGYGYDTLAAGKWHLSTYAIGPVASLDWPRRFGFEAFRAGRINNLGGSSNYFSWQRIDDGVQAVSTEYNTSAIRRAAVDWWALQPRPRFAYVAFHASHAPYHAPPTGLLPAGYAVGASNRSRFEAMVVAMDTEVGRLLAGIDRSNTYVFFLGDNGTPPDAVAAGQDPAKVKGSVYEGGINVPLIVTGPGVPRGRECKALVSLTDVFATAMELVHLPIPAGHALDSVSFAPQLFHPGRAGRSWVYSQVFAPNGPGPKSYNQRAVVTKRYKLFTYGTQELLFDLRNDPDELAPILPGSLPLISAALHGLLDSMLAQGAP